MRVDDTLNSPADLFTCNMVQEQDILGPSISKPLILFSTLTVRVQVSHTYRKVNMARECLSFTCILEASVICLSFYISFSFVRAAVVWAILDFDPSSNIMKPRYLKRLLLQASDHSLLCPARTIQLKVEINLVKKNSYFIAGLLLKERIWRKFIPLRKGPIMKEFDSQESNRATIDLFLCNNDRNNIQMFLYIVQVQQVQVS